MKEYFAYQNGSYWIYKNDTTGINDSTSVSSYIHVNDDKEITGITRELISMEFKSKFLGRSVISYNTCDGPNNYLISSIINPVTLETADALAFTSNCSPDTKIIPGCLTACLFFYRIYPTDTLDHVAYQNVIYSEIQTADSSSTNPNLFIRKICFAKHIGIIKYYEFSARYKINRSFSLLRYKISQ